MACFTYVEACYNPSRIHSGLGRRSPVDCEKTYHHAQASAVTSLPIQVHPSSTKSGQSQSQTWQVQR